MLTYDLKGKDSRPLYQQLYRNIRQDIESGFLSSGEKMPSKRKLASHLKISVATVENAYEQLQAEGYLHAEPKRGFFVQTIQLRKSIDLAPQSASCQEHDTKPVVYRYDFRTNAVDTRCFPFATWAKLMRELLTGADQSLLTAADPQGILPLRQAIIRYLYEFRGIEALPEQVIVGAGSEYLTGLLIQLLGRDKGYGVENPGYHKIHKIFEKNGAPVCAVPLDGQGLQVDRLRQTGAQIVHVTPSHHFPLGIVMPVARRQELLNWAAEQDGRYIIEDDYDSEFRFSGRPIPALQSLDRKERVIYMNTFAKSLAPSLRIGYLVLPAHLLEHYRKEFLFYASTVPRFEQHTLALFLERGHFERHIARMRNSYKTRRNALTEAILQSQLAKQVRISGENAGLHLLLEVENGLDEATLVARAGRVGVRVYGLSQYYAFPDAAKPTSTLVLGYSQLRPEDMAPAVSLLEEAWNIPE